MEQESIDQSAVEMAVAGMNHHSSRFVYDENIIIFIYYIERNVLRHDIHPAAAVRHHETDDIPGTHQQIGLGRLIPHLHISLLDGALDTVAGGVFQMGRHELVDADGLLPGIDIQPKMLEHTLFGILNQFIIGPVYHNGYFDNSAILLSSVVSQRETEAPMVWGPPAWLGDCL